jgi:hypothetical protein
MRFGKLAVAPFTLGCETTFALPSPAGERSITL